MRWLLITYIAYIVSCTEPVEYVTRELTIWNKYVSNGYDNYDNEIEVNLKLGSRDWFWLYDSGDRVKIYNNSSFTWQFEFSEDFDSLYVHARFYYTKDLIIELVVADTALRMDSDKTLMFWNCGDTTDIEYPFPACFTEVDSL